MLDVVTHQLRAVTITEDDDLCYTAYFYYSGIASEHTIDLWSCAVTEGSAGLGTEANMLEKYLRIDPPTPLKIEGSYVYLKRGEAIDSAHVFHISLKKLNTVTLRIALQNALLGKIPDQVREISIDIHNGNPRISVYIDTQEMGECISSLESAFKPLQQDLPEGSTLETAYQYLPIPQRVQSPGPPTSWCVYARYEDSR
jgi:hypothetical protein